MGSSYFLLCHKALSPPLSDSILGVTGFPKEEEDQEGGRGVKKSLRSHCHLPPLPPRNTNKVGRGKAVYGVSTKKSSYYAVNFP